MPKRKSLSHNQHCDRLKINELQNTAESWDLLTPALTTVCLKMRSWKKKKSNCLKHILGCILVIPFFGIITSFVTLTFLARRVHWRVETKCFANWENVYIFTVFLMLVTNSCIWPCSHCCAIHLQSKLVLHVCPLTQCKTFSSTCCNHIPLRLPGWSRRQLF